MKDEAVRALLMKLVHGYELRRCEPCHVSSVRRLATHRHIARLAIDDDVFLCATCAQKRKVIRATVVPLDYGPELERVLSFYPLPEDPKAYDVP